MWAIYNGTCWRRYGSNLLIHMLWMINLHKGGVSVQLKSPKHYRANIKDNIYPIKSVMNANFVEKKGFMRPCSKGSTRNKCKWVLNELGITILGAGRSPYSTPLFCCFNSALYSFAYVRIRSIIPFAIKLRRVSLTCEEKQDADQI